MRECHTIQKISQLEQYLNQSGRDLLEFDEQLVTGNNGFVHYLESGEVIFLPHTLNPKADGILFKTIECYKKIIRADKLPVENPNKTIFEEKSDFLMALNEEKIDHFKEYIEHRLNIAITEVTQQTIDLCRQTFQDKIEVKNYTPMDYLSFYVLIAESLRKKSNGKWILLKEYVEYNPYFKPFILNGNNLIASLLLENQSRFLLETSSANIHSIFSGDQKIFYPNILDQTHITEDGFVYVKKKMDIESLPTIDSLLNGY